MKPINKERISNISVALFRNIKEIDNKKKVFDTINIQKSYTDEQGNWKNTNSFSITDIPKIQLALSKTYDKVMSGQIQEIQEEKDEINNTQEVNKNINIRNL